MAGLIELDSLEILDIIDGEVDVISGNRQPALRVSGQMPDIARRTSLSSHDRRDAQLEMRMDNICCGAHGLSLMITGVKDGEKHTLLFDAGPEGDLWERNAKRLRADLASVELVHLSHWHRDHSGGLLQAISMISEARRHAGKDAVLADMHPDRPVFRGLNVGGPVSMEADPELVDIEKAGASVSASGDQHSVLDEFFLVSGEIPMFTKYEKGLARGIRFNVDANAWEKDEAIRDERFVICNLKGKGLVVFTGCSHRGVINACKHAMKIAGGSHPLYAVVGGYHLADGTDEKVQDTVRDFKELGVKMLLAGHCTGWRAKFAIENELPGILCPCFVGTRMDL